MLGPGAARAATLSGQRRSVGSVPDAPQLRSQFAHGHARREQEDLALARKSATRGQRRQQPLGHRVVSGAMSCQQSVGGLGARQWLHARPHALIEELIERIVERAERRPATTERAADHARIPYVGAETR